MPFRILVVAAVANFVLLVTNFYLSSSPTKYGNTGHELSEYLAMPELENVALYFGPVSSGSSSLYGVHDDASWQAMFPKGGGFVYLGANHTQYGVSMWHQLHCLNLIRLSLHERGTDGLLPHHIQHCFNYLRQMILCAADTTLEPVIPHLAMRAVESKWHRCRDWEAVYEVVQRNQAEYYERGSRTE